MRSRRTLTALRVALLVAVALALGAGGGQRLPGPGRHARRLARGWMARIAVAGHSMEPTIRQGDWLLVDPDAYRGRTPARGELVLAPDPRQERRLLVKRVAAVTPGGGLLLAGDAPNASTDWRTFGALAPERVLGGPWFRYWPVGRIGRVS